MVIVRDGKEYELTEDEIREAYSELEKRNSSEDIENVLETEFEGCEFLNKSIAEIKSDLKLMEAIREHYMSLKDDDDSWFYDAKNAISTELRFAGILEGWW